MDIHSILVIHKFDSRKLFFRVRFFTVKGKAKYMYVDNFL